ncbi:DUF4386 domain-containing protein [Leucobacter weissii]|uniref:DUF4386 domain-containing protein n=1 Tax=Leucobacter weissii TaxID=1983706 RepID=A0A939MKA0_9MICO|nr:DUF4386 domain-containing protein [Leucobacter weissii]MBO1901790.1 DUF4386 domain-containing protein [Leucobacter weissii]
MPLTTLDRRAARIVGALYLATFATSFPGLALRTELLHGGGPVALAPWAALLEIVLALSCVGTAVALLPIAWRRAPALGIGFVSSRLLEASAILVGALALLSVATVRGEAGSGGSGGEIEGALIALHDWSFLLGPGLFPAVNALLLGALLHRYRLVPRVLPLLAFIGAPLLIASFLGTLFGALDQVSPLSGLAALPIAAWELGLGLWLLIRGVRTPAGAPDSPPEHP